MLITLQQVHQFLIENKYLLASKEKGYTISKKYNDDVKVMKRGEPNMSVVPKDVVKATEDFFMPKVVLSTSLPKNEVATLSKSIDWPVLFIQFITDAKVPRQLEDNRGGMYPANKYSEDGMKAFRKAMEAGVVYDVLVKSTMLYYKSGTRYKKAVGNYFAEGHWRTDYQNLLDAASQGTTKLDNHIKQETKTNEHTPYRMG